MHKAQTTREVWRSRVPAILAVTALMVGCTGHANLEREYERAPGAAVSSHVPRYKGQDLWVGINVFGKVVSKTSNKPLAGVLVRLGTVRQSAVWYASAVAGQETTDCSGEIYCGFLFLVAQQSGSGVVFCSNDGQVPQEKYEVECSRQGYRNKVIPLDKKTLRIVKEGYFVADLGTIQMEALR